MKISTIEQLKKALAEATDIVDTTSRTEYYLGIQKGLQQALDIVEKAPAQICPNIKKVLSENLTNFQYIEGLRETCHVCGKRCNMF